MNTEKQFKPEPRRRDEPEPRDQKSQGIVRDEKGQEQPADKERAQRVQKTREGQTHG